MPTANPLAAGVTVPGVTLTVPPSNIAVPVCVTAFCACRREGYSIDACQEDHNVESWDLKLRKARTSAFMAVSHRVVAG